MSKLIKKKTPVIIIYCFMHNLSDRITNYTFHWYFDETSFCLRQKNNVTCSVSIYKHKHRSNPALPSSSPDRPASLFPSPLQTCCEILPICFNPLLCNLLFGLYNGNELFINIRYIAVNSGVNLH